MCCLFLVLVFAGPRLATILWWLFDTSRFNWTFSTIIVPILGIIFLPFTTLMYIIVFPGGITGFDWLFLGLALAGDIGSYTGAYIKTD